MSKSFYCCSPEHGARAGRGSPAHPHSGSRPGGTYTGADAPEWKCACCAEAERAQDEAKAEAQRRKVAMALQAHARALRAAGLTDEQIDLVQAESMRRLAANLGG